MNAAAPQTEINPDEIIVCPTCDAAYHLQRPSFDERAVCERCHTALITPRRKAGMQIIALALSVLILVVAAVCFPFLSIRAAGATNSISVLETALAFRGEAYGPLAWVVLGFIVVIPFVRAVLSIYVLVPLVFERPVYRGAKEAFKWLDRLHPWSMAEIFVLGCAVALVKVADLAEIRFGAAFWMFCGLVVVVLVQDSFLCRWSVWNSLVHPRKQ
ncbi:paraquat-inducible protein A [Alphaproteobacteria bacterium KMM 3653]|uniref:Paraquat-inducible protein A n=1 Tax=Harenicola maris TaxID=2841044 RepID=A0AAP2CXR7_9RHOB|nr:paraquat-inducible protein A [Harenicola maris]